MLRAPERGIHGVWTRSVARLRRAARALAARAPRGAWRAAAAALVSLNRSGRRAEVMRAAGSSDRRTCSIDRAATSAGRACAAVAGVAASSGRRRTQAAIASMWNAARRAHGSLLSVPARRNRALALPGVLAAASAVLGACYSARIWHGGVFRLSKTTVVQRWVLALSLCERAELIGQSSWSFQTALLSMRLPKQASKLCFRAVFATGSSAAETRRKGRLERPSGKSGTTRT